MVIGPVIVRVINKIRGVQPRYLRTAAKDYFAGVTFNANGHYIVKKNGWMHGRRNASSLNYEQHFHLLMEHLF